MKEKKNNNNKMVITEVPENLDKKKQFRNIKEETKIKNSIVFSWSRDKDFSCGNKEKLQKKKEYCVLILVKSFIIKYPQNQRSVWSKKKDKIEQILLRLTKIMNNQFIV